MKLYAELITHKARAILGNTEFSSPSECEVLWVQLKRFDLSGFPKLKYIACPCTGLDHIDLAECKRRNIRVLSLRDTDVLPTITATAEHTIGLILALVRKIPQAVESTRRGEWDRSRFMGRELSEMKFRLVGHGRIGNMISSRLHAFGCHYANPELAADIVSIHVDLNDSTRGMCNAEFFAAMKPGSYFVNTSRGQVVDEAALLASLRSGHLAGAALDVICGEPDHVNPPLPNINPLFEFARQYPDKLILTPHIGGFTSDSLEKAEVALARKLIEVVNGTER